MNFSEQTTGNGETANRWYALRVRSNFEWVAAQALRERGFEENLPSYRSRRRWSDRVKEVEAPLFPGYLFCRFNLQNRLPILTAPGVLHIVGSGKIPQPVDEQELLAVRTLARSGSPVTPWPFLRTGQRVELEYGPLAGLEGILVAVKNVSRIVVSVSLLQRSISAEVDSDWVRPVGQPMATPSFSRIK
jgi:transcription antitermination factor NusG